MDSRRPKRLRYSLVTLGGIMSLVAVALAALNNPNPWWAVGLVHLTFLMLLWAAISGVYARRPFAGGLAIGGVAWLCLLVVFAQPAMRSPDNWPSGYEVNAEGAIVGTTKGPYAIEENPLAPEQICHWLASCFHDVTRTRSLYMPEREFRCFRVIAYCAATWLIGLLTGTAALLIRPADASNRCQDRQ